MTPCLQNHSTGMMMLLDMAMARRGIRCHTNPSDPVLGTDMTQGEWDQLRELMRKAEAGGKMNELLTVNKKEVKNAPMNRHYPPDDDEWKDCEESQVPPSPSKVHAPSGTNSSAGSADNKAPPGALWPDAYNQTAWKVPPIAPPPTFATSWREFRVRRCT